MVHHLIFNFQVLLDKFKGGRPGAPFLGSLDSHTEGGRPEAPFLGSLGESRLPHWGNAPPCVSPRLPKKSAWGNAPPRDSSFRVRGVRGVRAPDPGGHIPVEHCCLLLNLYGTNFLLKFSRGNILLG